MGNPMKYIKDLEAAGFAAKSSGGPSANGFRCARRRPCDQK
jgi:hypothetical protein